MISFFISPLACLCLVAHPVGRTTWEGIYHLEVAGKRCVTARDIAVPHGVEIMNPDLHLATLTSENASLSLDLLMETGKGYVPIDAQEVLLSTEVIPLDAIYSPIQQVSYSIEKTRVSSLVNFEKLVLTFSTDGTMTPNDALCGGFWLAMWDFTSALPKAAHGVDKRPRLVLYNSHLAVMKLMNERYVSRILPE